MNSNGLDYRLILEECGIYKAQICDVIKNINLLKNKYTDAQLINIYNHILINIKNYEILTHTVKLLDLYKNDITLSILLNYLQLENETDNDESINFKIICIKAIANYKNNSTVTALLNCMNNKNEHYRIRLACADALGRIGNKYAVNSLINVVEDENEKSLYLKESATFALGLIGDTSAIDPLISILESKQGFLDKFSFLKEKIIEALGKLNFNNKRVFNALKLSLMDPSPLVRINAIEAIMNSGEEESINLIRSSLDDEDNEVKKNALIALYNLIGRDVLDEIISLPIYSDFLKEEAQILINEYEENYE